jgi:SAM-dependent methyltransferase
VRLVAAGPRMGAEKFERLYTASGDPWNYGGSDYEREKYASTLAALPSGAFGAALEVGCSIGVFTEQLAKRCERVLAVDFSPRAMEYARARLRRLENVRLAEVSFPEQAPDGPWDLVVCSEVLYYLDEPALRAALDWLERQLRRGACVLTVSWRGAGSSEPLRGDDVHDLLAEDLARWHVLDARHPGYRLDRFDGDGG